MTRWRANRADRTQGRAVALGALVLMVACGCGCQETAAPNQAAPTAPAEATRPRPQPWQPSPNRKVASFGGLEAPKPVIWLEHPPQGIGQIARYVVPGRDGGNQADIDVFFFENDVGGTIEDHIERWRSRFEPDAAGQHPEATIREIAAQAMDVTLVELAGNYVRPGNQWYTRDQIVMTAIVQRPGGRIFIRLTGESGTVEHTRDAFLAMLSGLREAAD